jgi:hypothetical protein
VSAALALRAALDRLEAIFDDALEVAMPNPVALRFSDLRLGYQGKRDLVFALDLLLEGENEAALIAGIARDALEREPDFDVAHLIREAWYYLRTSIDPAWQFDESPPDFDPALSYIGHVLRERIAQHVPQADHPTDEPTPDHRRALLLAARDDAQARRTS